MLCNVNGDTPMHLAVKFGHAEVVQCLMKLKKAKIPSQRSTEASQVIKKPKKGFSTPTHSLHLPDQENVIDFHKSTPCLKVEPIESHSVSHEVKNSSLSNLNLCPTPNMEILQSAKGSRRNSLDSIKCSILWKYENIVPCTFKKDDKLEYIHTLSTMLCTTNFAIFFQDFF